MSSFAFQVGLLILLLGGAIAYIGNRVGKYIGKRRLTIFNLRPRYTANAITVLSGIFIALITAAVLLTVSQDARTALLGLDRLKNEIRQKTSELNRAREEFEKLNSSLWALRREIRRAREGQVVFRVGDVISLSLIQAGPERSKLEAGLKRIVDSARVVVHREEFDRALDLLVSREDIYIVKLVAARNILRGEEVAAKIVLLENKLVYRGGEEISALDIPAGLSAAGVEAQITNLLTIVHRAARDAGVLPDNRGSLGSVPYAEISELAKKIQISGRSVTVKALTAQDIYAIGPLSISFKLNFR